MLYTSTHDNGPRVSFTEAVLRSAPAGGGLYMPCNLPVIPAPFFMNFAEMSFVEIAYVLANQLFGGDVDSASLKRIVEESFNFPVPLRHVGDNLYALELFHGPTLAFKDFGARFMAKLLGHLHNGKGGKTGKLHVLIATNGNTGSAIANGFAGISNVETFILFPRGHAGRQLEAQFTTLGGNIHALEVQGTIDDCHSLVQQAYSDVELNGRVTLTSANSLNIARLLPQTFYYFYAMAKLRQLTGTETPVTVAIPSGNLGNLTAAVASRRMGLPMHRILACENANAYLHNMLVNGHVDAPRAIPTLACAADKGRPSNIDRLMYLCGNSQGALAHEVEAHTYDDAAIIDAVNDCYHRYGYTIDPHTALAYQGLRHHLGDGETGLMIATGHPAKSLTAMSAITGRAMDLPLQLTHFMAGRDLRKRIQPSYTALRNIIMEHS